MNKTKKTVFEGSLAKRAFLICLTFLIIPLFVHSFLLYKKEIELEEALIRTDLRALGALKANSLTNQIHNDWQLLEARASGIEIQTIPLPANAKSHFVQIEKNSLYVGLAVSETDAIAIEHPLQSFLAFSEPASFPVDIAFSPSLPDDQWQETFPIPDTSLTLTIGTSSQRIYELQTWHLLLRIASFLFIVAILGGFIVYILLRKTYRPLHALRLTMERVANGAIHSRYTPHRWGFEINAIGQLFNDTLDAVLLHQAEAEKERTAREKLAQELKLGAQIQENLLPHTFPSLENCDIGAGYLPATEVGGDFYDVFALAPGKSLIVVADLAGKGISACLFSLGLRSCLRALATATDNLGEIVQKANELFLLDAQETGEFATLWIGILESNKLTYLSLGHPPGLLKRQGQMLELSTNHPALGLMPLNNLQETTVRLEPGDGLLLYSDGTTEAHNTSQELYGLPRLKEAYTNTQISQAQVVVNHILQDIQRFSKGALQHDDLTLLYIFCK